MKWINFKLILIPLYESRAESIDSRLMKFVFDLSLSGLNSLDPIIYFGVCHLAVARWLPRRPRKSARRLTFSKRQQHGRDRRVTPCGAQVAAFQPQQETTLRHPFLRKGQWVERTSPWLTRKLTNTTHGHLCWGDGRASAYSYGIPRLTNSWGEREPAGVSSAFYILV